MRDLIKIANAVGRTVEGAGETQMSETLDKQKQLESLIGECRKEESSNKTVEILNEAFAKDPNAIHALMANRYPCNRALADDPYIQVDKIPVIDGEHFQVGALGLINGILAANGMPLVASKWSTDKDDESRPKLEGFCEYNKFTLVEVTKPQSESSE
jgi:hypothetical protein